jgi:ATP-dependent Clp protease ATP-binding subunit ClpA
MDDNMAEMVVEKKLGELAVQLKAKNIAFEADDSAKALVKKKGVSQEFGAREVDRVIRNEIKPLFVDEILFGKLKNGGSIILSAADEQFAVSAEKKGKA